jgi:hypothetical protein
MTKTLLLTSAVSGLMLSAAFAQSPMSPTQSQADPPTVTAPAGQSHSATPNANENAAKPALPTNANGMAQNSQPQFITSQGADNFVYSTFKGADVLGPDNKKIGDITDFVFDRDHKIVAYVVGVGGFLGIGEKNVAVDPSAFMAQKTDDDPNKVKLKVSWTKDEIKNAPDFKYYEEPAKTASQPHPSTTGVAPMGAPPADRH